MNKARSSVCGWNKVMNEHKVKNKNKTQTKM